MGVASVPTLRGSVPFLQLPAPRLPASRRETHARSLTISLAVHLIAVLLVTLVVSRSIPIAGTVAAPAVSLPRMVFIVSPGPGGGGGGGGQRDRSPARRASDARGDTVTLSVAPPIASDAPPLLESPLLARSLDIGLVPLAPGVAVQAGAIDGPAAGDPSAGPGRGGGFGEGEGTGIGAGSGSGIGPGAGGGFGGGAYRPGNGVTSPVLLRQQRPSYTAEAMRKKIQGSVTLEAVVLPDGSVGSIRIVRSLDRGLDEEAARAARQWVFLPGRRNGEPVAVLVQIIMDFTVY